jgi:hypothetical protein
MVPTHYLPAAAPVSPPPRPKLKPGEFFWAALPLIAVLLLAALIVYLVKRWMKRKEQVAPEAAGDQLSHFRSLYERGEMSREEFERVRALLAGQLRKEMNVPTPQAPSPATPPEAIPPPPQPPPNGEGGKPLA